MAYSSGFLHHRITIATRSKEQNTNFGKSGQPSYVILGTFWANASYLKGTKKLQEGAMDSINTMLFRMRYHGCIDEWCLVQYHGKWYNLTSCNGDEEANEMQMTGTIMPNQAVNIIEPSES